jgi:hypothetical protein
MTSRLPSRAQLLAVVVVARDEAAGAARSSWRQLGLFGLGVVVAVALCAEGDDAAQRLRLWGMWMQLFGVGLIAYDLAGLRQEYARAPMWRRVVASLTRIVAPLRPKHAVIHVGAGAISLSGSAALAVSSIRGGTVEQRLDHLEASVRRLDDQIKGSAAQSREAIDALRAELASKAADLRRDQQALRDHTESVLAGGLGLQWVGAWWLLLATVASSAPDEVVGLARSGWRWVS